MRKVILVVSVIVTVYCSFIPQVQSEKEVRIPDEAIRLRILANSNDAQDQREKLHVRDQVNYYIADKVQGVENKAAVRKIIESHLPEIEAIVRQVIGSNDFHVGYSETVPFPKKTYGNYVYPAGHYEALLITIGSGEGDNWWCVLFPALCFVEFTAEDDEDVEEADELMEEEEEAEEPLRFFFLEWFGIV